jgi:hypothetical protein
MACVASPSPTVTICLDTTASMKLAWSVREARPSWPGSRRRADTALENARVSSGDSVATPDLPDAARAVACAIYAPHHGSRADRLRGPTSADRRTPGLREALYGTSRRWLELRRLDAVVGGLSLVGRALCGNTPCLNVLFSGAYAASLDVAGCGLMGDLAAQTVAGCRPTWPDICGRWLPVWLPGIGGAQRPARWS